jgi:hypothetical protein
MHTSRFYGHASGSSLVGLVHPWISLLHFTLSCTSFSDKYILFISFAMSPQVLLGLSLGLLPSTTNSVHFLTQPSSPFLLTCPNHVNLLLLHTSPIVSTSTLSLSFELVLSHAHFSLAMSHSHRSCNSLHNLHILSLSALTLEPPPTDIYVIMWAPPPLKLGGGGWGENTYYP